MNETHVTFVGNVATEIRATNSRDGVPITSFRLASTSRRFEKGKGWSDVDTLFVTVVCWRRLAEHAARSFSKGEPVIVTGRLRMRQWTAPDGRSGTSVELEAVAAGHDLSRGTAAFTRIPSRTLDGTASGTAGAGAGCAEQGPVEPGGEVVADEEAAAADVEVAA